MHETFLGCWFLTGSTAAGKTTVGLELAKQIDAEIVSLDSMALYRDMDIGTAKPTADQRSRVRHHLLDMVDPADEFSLAAYVQAAHEKVVEVRGRKKEVLFVGGTPLYLKSLLRGIFQGPPGDWEFRRQVMDEVQRIGTQALHDRLKQVDPLSAARLHPHDVRRIIRALEVYRLTGQPISHLQLQFDEAHCASRCKVFVLDWPRPKLHERIDRRVERMFTDGLIDEVRQLLQRYRQLSRTAEQAVGYREVIALLSGHLTQEETLHRMKVRTRRFAKRQETWFRSLSECRRVPCSSNVAPKTIAELIVGSISTTSAQGPSELS
jgi:tRNA dimethylallyltransferase